MPDTGLRLQRPNLVVADLDRSLRFYRDILGFTVDFTKDSDDASYSYPVFEIPRHAELRFCVLSANQDQQRSLALTEITGIDLTDMPLPRRNALVLNIDAIDEVLDAARAEGLHVYEEERLETNDGRIGREIGIVDHDGHLVVIYKILQT
ncbi:MAG: VOC family protein [Gammaproteobacteria bacterium]|nr:VOC family protein [Gammaproteobacteria bacterium]